jgi:hypothetical protein
MMHFPHAMNLAGIEEDPLSDRRLAGVYMGDYADVSCPR